MMESISRQKGFFEFFLKEFEEPYENLTPETQEKLRFVLPQILKTVINLIELVENVYSDLEEKQKLEKLVENLQNKILEQDDLNLKLSHTFKELSKICELASHTSTPTTKGE